jgi:hypothetical protein
MTKQARELTPAWRGRVRYLIAVVVIEFFVDVFDGLVFPEETVEHWVEAAWWAVAVLGYLVLARRRPLPGEQRLADWGIAGCMALIGGTLVLRATLPDALAFRWSILLTAAFVAAAVPMIRHINRAGKASTAAAA